MMHDLFRTPGEVCLSQRDFPDWDRVAEIRYKKLDPTAKPPKFVNEYAAGMAISYCQRMTYNAWCKESYDAFHDLGATRAIISEITARYPKFNLYSNQELKAWIEPQTTVEIHTGIAVEIPKGYCGLLLARSGIANKYGITPADKCGVIDSDYRGELLLHLSNESHNIFHLEDGMRVAQLVIVPVVQPPLVEVKELTKTERGSKGMGSTGLQALDSKEKVVEKHVNDDSMPPVDSGSPRVSVTVEPKKSLDDDKIIFHGFADETPSIKTDEMYQSIVREVKDAQETLQKIRTESKRYRIKVKDMTNALMDILDSYPRI